MAEFLVEIAVALPADLGSEPRAELLAKERELGRKLVEEGAIVRIWRVPGSSRNVGIWKAPDATALHERLRSLPLAPWCDIRVTALAIHPLEGGPEV